MDNILTIWCFIEGGTRPFSIDISGKLVIDKLADAIYSKCSNMFQGVDVQELLLNKVWHFSLWYLAYVLRIFP